MARQSKNFYQYLCTKALAVLSPRQKEVIIRRFGLKGKEKETLEKIGRDFGITRERVRQLQNSALSKAAQAIESLGASFSQLTSQWVEFLKVKGGVMRKDDFVKTMAGFEGNIPRVNFILALQKSIVSIDGTGDIYPAVAVDKKYWEEAYKVISWFQDFLSSEGSTFSDREIYKVYQEKLEGKNSKEVFFTWLSLAKNIKRGVLGDWGLLSWPEVKPRGLRDLAYLVYRKEAKPLHFTEVARLINVYGLRPGKKALPQSVHNDLIRDPRFVLVGRGIYALREWGYEDGTVRDVIIRILEEAGMPLPASEIVRRVLEVRQVKEATVLMNLQNRNYFTRTEGGLYMLKPKVA